MNDADVVLVRRVGPTAWAVLELLRQRSTIDDRGELVADASVRSLAAELGLPKHTVHRALRRLDGAGRISARQARTFGGTFSHGQYVLRGADHLDDPRPRRGHTLDDGHPVRPMSPSSASSDQLTFGI